MKKYIYNFDELSAMLDKENPAVYVYACLLWLGIAPNDIQNVTAECFNENMHTINVRYRVIFIKNKPINDALSSYKSSLPITSQERRSADAALVERGLDWKYIYKMQLFASKRELEKSGQPEDIILFREMAAAIGKSDSQIKSEYNDYKASLQGLM